jgi:hypothetical protein
MPPSRGARTALVVIADSWGVERSRDLEDNSSDTGGMRPGPPRSVTPILHRAAHMR